jgi:hypothetical protein
MEMSAARPISTPIILLGLTAVAALGFWQGFRDSYFASGGIRNCVAGGQGVSGTIPLAQPMTTAPIPPASQEVKPVDAPKKPATTAKPTDPGVQTHDLQPLPKTPPAPKEDAPPGPPTPAKPPQPPGPDEPPY